MAYSDFTLKSVKESFDLQLADHPDLFGGVAAVTPSNWLTAMLAETVPLARAISTEKARSEWMIAPIIAEVRNRYKTHCSVFSGYEFDVDASRGLRGFCDFIIARSPIQHLLSAPAVMIAESKNGDLQNGYGQCIAGMVAARLFNGQHGQPSNVVYGVVSTGDHWGFMKLDDSKVTFDMVTYPIENLGKILGILAMIVAG